MKIMLAGVFEDKPVFRKFLILVSIILLSTIIFSMVGGLLVEFLFGVNMLNNADALSNLKDPNVISSMKLLQLLTTGIGMFLIPSLLAALLFHRQPKVFLGFKSTSPLAVFGYTVILMFAAVPLINVMMVFNQQLHLPEFMAGIETWMKESEANAARITEVFLTMNTTSELFYNLLIIAVLPAIGEELLFRGVLQRLFQEMTANIHVTIFITAALFSAIHMQFYGFLPRMFLGVLFGYLLVWTGNMWIPILAHFVNNAAAVLLAWYAGKNDLPFNQDTIGTDSGDLPFALISLVAVILILIAIKRQKVTKTEELNPLTRNEIT